MAYIRISIAKPRRGEEAHLRDILEQLNAEAAKHEGCLETYVLHPHDASGEIARLAIYESEEAAEAAASSDAILALRSEMHLLVEAGHSERAFFSAH